MAGGTLSEVYQQARHLLLRVRDGLEKLERLESHSSSSLPSSSGASGRSYDDSGTPDLAQNLKHDLSQLQTYSVEMDRLWRSQVPVSQRDLWKRKLEQVAEEVDSLKLGLDKYLSRRQRRQMEAKERAELLQRVNGDSAHVMQIFDDETRARQSARNSSNMLDEAYATGVAVLSKYAEQRDRLKIQRSSNIFKKDENKKDKEIMGDGQIDFSIIKVKKQEHSGVHNTEDDIPEHASMEEN